MSIGGLRLKDSSGSEGALARRLAEAQQEAVERTKHILRADETIRAVCPVDLNQAGQFTKGWILFTNQRLLTYFDGAPEPDVQVEADHIVGVKVDHSVGNSTMYVDTAEGTLLLARFSRSLALPAEEFRDEIESVIDQTADEECRAGRELERQRRKTKREALRHEVTRKCPKCGYGMRGPTCRNCVQTGAMMRRLLGYLRPYMPQVLVSMVLLLGGAVLQILPPRLTGILVDEVLIQSDMARLWYLVTILGLAYLGAALLTGAKSYLMAWVGQRVVRDLRSQVFHHLQYLRMQFYNNQRTGAIMSRATNDTDHLQRFVVHSAQDVLLQLVMMIGVGIIMFTYNWKLAVFTLLPMPLIVMSTQWFSRKIRKVYRRIWVRRALMNSVLADAIPGIQVVKSFAQEAREIKKFDHRSDQVFERQVDAARFRSIFMPFLNLSTAIGTLIIWGYGGFLVIVERSLSIGDLVAFLYYLNMFYNPVRQLSGFSDIVQEAATAGERVFEILDTEPEMKTVAAEPKAPRQLKQIEGAIEFRDVHFAYNASEPVLEGINVKIRPGEMIGLVGPSGSGKTTIANLIPRLYDVTSGQILIDGHDVRDLDLNTLRQHIGVVLQEPLLFHGTIADNIAYGVPNASREEVIWAAQAANAHNFIMGFADGYDTHTGERGLRLSGGQKQRISIARAILKNPKILILDEATSAVDTETEKLIQEAIERLTDNRTTIAIAHRLSTLQNADRLLVIQGGRLVEEGTHTELLAQDGVFAKLVRMQTEIAQSRAV